MRKTKRRPSMGDGLLRFVIAAGILCAPSYAAAATKADMTAPAPGSSLTASTVLFQWNGGIGVSQYWLEIGTEVGGFDVYGKDAGTNLSATVSGLPINGSTLYVRLWSLINSAWVWNDYTYQAANVANMKAQMTAPAPGSTLTATTVTFQWSGGTGVSQYWLEIGSKVGGFDLYGQDARTNLSAFVFGLPSNGTTLYVRLWSLIGGTWVWNDYTYQATTVATAKAELTTPAPGSTLTASTVTFWWSGGTGVSQYWLEIGTKVGGFDVYGKDAGTNLSATVSGLPIDGSTLYVRLWSLINGAWVWNGYIYQAATAVNSKAQMTAPAPGSTLTATTVTFQWSGGIGVSQYWLEIGTKAGGFDLYGKDAATNLSATVTGLPNDGSTMYVRLWSFINGAWVWNDYTYTAVSIANAKAQMTTPAPASTLTASRVTFQWSGGSGVAQYWLEIGTRLGGFDLYGQSAGTNLAATVSGLPNNGSNLYVRLWSLINGVWVWNDYTYQAAAIASAKAEMTAPTPGSTLTATRVTFQWNGGTGVSQYWLEIGNNTGGFELYGKDAGINLSATVSGLPNDGRQLRVRLWSLINGAWVWNDYTYHAASSFGPAIAQMLTPAPGSTLTGSTVTFQWDSGRGATKHALAIGTSRNAYDLFFWSGWNSSVTVTGLPTNGATVYVRLESLLDEWVDWQFVDYTYQAATAP